MNVCGKNTDLACERQTWLYGVKEGHAEEHLRSRRTKTRHRLHQTSLSQYKAWRVNDPRTPSTAPTDATRKPDFVSVKQCHTIYRITIKTYYRRVLRLSIEFILPAYHHLLPAFV